MKYKKGKHNCLADFLSSIHQTTYDIDEDISCFSVCYEPDPKGTEPGDPRLSRPETLPHCRFLIMASATDGGDLHSTIFAEEMLQR